MSSQCYYTPVPKHVKEAPLRWEAARQTVDGRSKKQENNLCER